MDAVLRQYVPPEGSYLELIFDQMIKPWYRGIGPRGAMIYTRISSEIRLLKEKKKKDDKKNPQVWN